MSENSSSILITGAGGFLGYHMANYLSDRGHRVDGMDIHFADKPVDGSPARFKVIREDFRNWETTRQILVGKEFVFHFASAHLQISLDEKEYWDINVHGLRKLIEEAHRAGVKRFVHVSSVGAYGKLEKVPADEETPCHPQSIYGETKLAGEKEVIEYCRKNGMDFVILRPTWIYGLGCPRTAKLHRMLGKNRFIMIGKGGNKRHPMYIKDMLDAFRLAMECPEASGQTMIIGGNQIVTSRELIDAFCRVLNLPGPLLTLPYPLGLLLAAVAEGIFTVLKKEPPVSRRTLEFFDTDNGFDVRRMQQVLAFTPRYSLEAGLADYKEVVSKL